MSALRLVELRSLRRVPHAPRIPLIPQSPIRFLEEQSSRHSFRTWRRVGTPSTGALVLYRTQQSSRYQSSSPDKRSAGQNQPTPTPTPTPSLGAILRALRDGFRFRPLLSAFRGQSLRSLYRQSPEELVMALILLACAAGVCVYVVYAYFHYFQSKQFTRFPPHIAKSLRRALYYSNYSPDPPLALKYYKMALEQCTAAGLDPFSDEVMGIKIQLAAWLEKIGSYKNSIEVLEALLRDCKKWVEVMEKSVEEGLVDKSGHLFEPEKSALVTTPPQGEAGAESNTEEEVDRENLWGKRRRVLGRSVGISTKLGELYADEHVLQGDMAGERLIWAVETILKELQRRQTEGVKEGEGDWMSPEEIGGALEALGNHYESKSQHYLAAPLFLQAITLSPPKSCHTAVLMNNLAISLAQQPVNTPAAVTSTPKKGQEQAASQTPTRATLLTSARQWALQAEATTHKVQGEDRTEECDEACAVALCNLADIAAMMGDNEEAKRRFREGLEFGRKVGFEPAVAQAEEGLKRVSEA